VRGPGTRGLYGEQPAAAREVAGAGVSGWLGAGREAQGCEGYVRGAVVRFWYAVCKGLQVGQDWRVGARRSAWEGSGRVPGAWYWRGGARRSRRLACWMHGPDRLPGTGWLAHGGRQSRTLDRDGRQAQQEGRRGGEGDRAWESGTESRRQGGDGGRVREAGCLACRSW
jgi:hypothetical protein